MKTREDILMEFINVGMTDSKSAEELSAIKQDDANLLRFVYRATLTV